MTSSNPSAGIASFCLPHSDYDVVGSIVLYNTAPQEVENAVGQFLAAPVRSHLCVLDNSPAPNRLAIYEDPRVSYLFCDGNLGYGRAHNIALRAAAACSRYSLVMNTDITYPQEVIPKLVAFMDRNPQAGMTAPKILYPDGSLQYVCRLLPHPGNLILRRFLPGTAWTQRADARYELRWWKHDQIANIPYFQGSFMLMRTDRSLEVGGFDERFFLYGEDIDLTRRLHAISETLYIPDVHVIHEYRRYSKHSLRGTWYGIQNNCRYFNKWGWIFDRDRRRINSSVVARLTSSAVSAS
jgi:GT2 family glycosyltransferase